MKNNTLTPQIRFKGFEEEWKETMIGNLLSIGNGCDYKHLESGDIPVFGTGGLMTTVNQYLYDGESVFIGRKGTIDKPFYYNGKFWTVDTLFYTHSFKGSIPSYIFPLFQTINWYLYNAATGVPSLSKECILDIKVKIAPSLAEQSAIGEYFRRVDELIAEAEREVSRLEKMKQASLQKMFPRPGESVPEVRFAGFTEDWKVGKLSNLLDIDDNRNSQNDFGRSDVLSVSGEYGLVNQIEFQGRSFAGVSLTNYKITRKGQVVYTKSPLKAQPYGIFKSNQYGVGLLSPLYAVFNPKSNVCADFIHYYFEPLARLNNYLRPLINKGAKNTILISDEAALEGEVTYPKQIQEQIQIAEYFLKLDSLIDARRRRVAKLRDIKKACLDRMFAASAPNH